MKISNFNKTNLKTLRDELNAVLAKYGTETGVNFTFGTIRFSENEFSTKLTGAIPGAVTKTDEQLIAIAKLNGLTLEPYNGRQLVGYNSRAYKMPFIWQDLVSKKKFKSSKSTALFYFKKAA